MNDMARPLGHRRGLLLATVIMFGSGSIGAFVLASPHTSVSANGQWAFAGLIALLVISYATPIALRVQRGEFDPFEPPIVFSTFFL